VRPLPRRRLLLRRTQALKNNKTLENLDLSAVGHGCAEAYITPAVFKGGTVFWLRFRSAAYSFSAAVTLSKGVTSDDLNSKEDWRRHKREDCYAEPR
jgi:hypothetical protein